MFPIETHLTEAGVAKMIAEAGDFPGLSREATEIARMTSELSAPVQEIAELLQSESALWDRMRQVISSPFYGLSGDITDVGEAISLIGYKKVCNLAVSIALMDEFPAESSGYFNYARFWERAICMGVAAGEIAARLPGDLPGEAFSAGFLQDMGMLFLLRYRPLDYGIVMGISMAKSVHIARVEREEMGVDHALVGQLLFRHWKMPSLLIEVIRHHHFSEFNDSVPSGTKTMVQVMNLSNLVADVLLEGNLERHRRTLDSRARSFFGLGPKVVEELLGRVPEQTQKIGSAFSIEVGARSATRSEAAAPKGPEKLLDKCPKCGTENDGKFCSQCGASMVAEPPKPKRVSNKILVAEDSIASRRALCFVIKKLGYIPVEATNGHEAVELAREDPPGMIMLDIMMPRMNGLEALKRIRSDKETADVPVVMLTSLTDNETVVEAVQAGANDYVVKPYTADIITQRVTKYMPEKAKRRV